MAEVDLERLDVAALVMLAGEAVRRVVTERVHAAGFADVRPAHGYVFQCLIHDQPTVTDIGRTLGMTQQGASKLVVELERLGYVERSADSHDSRARRVSLTERGRACVEAGRCARADLEADLSAHIGDTCVESARAALAGLADRLGLRDAVGGRQVAIPERER